MFLSNGVECFCLLSSQRWRMVPTWQAGPRSAGRSEREPFEVSLPTSSKSKLAGAIKPFLSQSVFPFRPWFYFHLHLLLSSSPPPPPSTCGLSSRGLATTAPSSVASLFLPLPSFLPPFALAAATAAAAAFRFLVNSVYGRRVFRRSFLSCL